MSRKALLDMHGTIIRGLPSLAKPTKGQEYAW
jgi:hypothetical protein